MIKYVNFLERILAIITKVLSPPYCVWCENLLPNYTVLCSVCRERVPVIGSCQVFLSSTRSMAVHAYTAYQEPFDRLIQAKLNGQQTPIFQLGTLIAEYVKKLSLECDMIVPVPLHWQRNMWRGFNQAEILAQSIAPVVGKPIITALVRHKKTQFQSALSATQRKENVTHIFSLNKRLRNCSLRNKRILLIDDLYTTGVTAQTAALELYKHGAQSVELLVVCKVVN